MSIEREEDGFLFNHDLPHENTMDRIGFELEDFDTGLRAKIRRIDDLFLKAMEDGYVDDKEEEELITLSYKVSEEIEKRNNEGANGGENLTIIGGLLLLLGAAIGIKQLSK